MSGSTYGTLFTVTTFGESHGEALGAVIDGCPANLPLSEKDIQPFLDRRKPGTSSLTTQRKEADEVQFLSGVFDGKTTGAPIAMMVKNTSQRSNDYSNIMNVYRPGHADYTFDSKYGIRDYRGGGRSSGRETIGRVCAGAVASKILKELGIEIMAYTKSIGPVEISYDRFNKELIHKLPTSMPDEIADKEATDYLTSLKENKDSSGGVIEIKVTGVPAGLGDPVFEKLDANLSKALMSIGAVKAVEIGDGVSVSVKKGSENNDSFVNIDGNITKKTNHCGGILGGISDGDIIILRAHVKPTPSIYQPQQTIDKEGKNTEIAIIGRHDPVVVPRAVVVCESMVAITILDAYMKNMTSKMEYLKNLSCEL